MDELWGLATHPTEPQFLTAGSDKLVQLWDSTTNAVIWREEVSVSQNLFCNLKIRDFMRGYHDQIVGLERSSFNTLNIF